MPAAISTTMIAATTQSTTMQSGGHQRLLATKCVRCCGERENAEDRIQQPGLHAARWPVASLHARPNDEREQQRRPDPAEDGEHAGADRRTRGDDREGGQGLHPPPDPRVRGLAHEAGGLEVAEQVAAGDALDSGVWRAPTRCTSCLDGQLQRVPPPAPRRRRGVRGVEDGAPSACACEGRLIGQAGLAAADDDDELAGSYGVRR